MHVSDSRQIVCPHGSVTTVRFTAESDDGILVSIDKIGCVACSEKLSGAGGASAEWRALLVRNYLTPALEMS